MKNNLSSHDVMKFFNLRLFTCAFLSALLLAFGAAPSFALSWAQSYGLGSYDINGAPGTDPFYSSGYDTPLAIAKMPDGGFVVAGYLAMPKVWLHPGSYGTLGALVRYSADGTILWQTLLKQDNDLYQNGVTYHALNNIGQIATDAQGNIFICGSKHGNGLTSNFNRGFVAKFSPDGALLWENGFNGGSATIGDPPHEEPIGTDAINYLGLTSDGGVIVTCAQSRPGFGYTIPVLAKFNADGTLAFTKAYDNAFNISVRRRYVNRRMVRATSWHSSTTPTARRRECVTACSCWSRIHPGTSWRSALTITPITRANIPLPSLRRTMAISRNFRS